MKLRKRIILPILSLFVLSSCNSSSPLNKDYYYLPQEVDSMTLHYSGFYYLVTLEKTDKRKEEIYSYFVDTPFIETESRVDPTISLIFTYSNKDYYLYVSNFNIANLFTDDKIYANIVDIDTSSLISLVSDIIKEEFNNK